MVAFPWCDEVDINNFSCGLCLVCLVGRGLLIWCVHCEYGKPERVG